MNMTRDVFVFVRDHENGHLVKVPATPTEAHMGRRLAATLQLAIREHAKNGRRADLDTSIGKITYEQVMFKRKHLARIRVQGGEFCYEEFRHWLVIAIQYITDTYPLISFTFDHSMCEIFIPENKRLSDFV